MGGGKEEKQYKTVEQICCEHTILRNVESFLEKKKRDG